MNKIIETVLKALEGFNGARSIKQKSRAFVELSVICDNANRIAEQYKVALMDAKVYECFPEYEQKIEYTPPKGQSHIDAVKLAKAMIKAGREKELFSIISVSEKALKTLADGEVLAGKYRVADEDTKAGLKVSKMTKAELKASKPE